MISSRSRIVQRLCLTTIILSGVAGAGTARAAPKILLDPAQLNFYEVGLGSPATSYFQITNPGKTQVVVMDMKIAGGDADQFHFDAANDPFCGNGRDCTPNFKLAPGTARAFPIACEPTRAGVFQTTLTVKSNGADSSIAMTCTGATPASMSTLVITPSLLDFGVSYAEGITNRLERTLTITNTATAPSLPVEFEIDDVTTGGNGFISPVEHVGSVAAGQTREFIIVFKWRGGVRITAPLVLRSTDPGHATISVPMFAEAGYGRLVFDDPPVPPFGVSTPAVAAGETSSVTIRAHNEGSLGVFVEVRARVSFGGFAEVLSPASVPVSPGQSIEWTIACTPDGLAPSEDGASGDISFQYRGAASDFDTLQLFCPVLGAGEPSASTR